MTSDPHPIRTQSQTVDKNITAEREKKLEDQLVVHFASIQSKVNLELKRKVS
jgi:hypothetical protein